MGEAGPGSNAWAGVPDRVRGHDHARSNGMSETDRLCNHDGGRGIGAGHVCRCNHKAGHPLDEPRPHGCSCGAMWADSRGGAR
jgi:hypothetical protein